MCDNPLIHLGSAVQNGKAFQFGFNLPNNPLGTAVDSEQNVKLILRDLWDTRKQMHLEYEGCKHGCGIIHDKDYVENP